MSLSTIASYIEIFIVFAVALSIFVYYFEQRKSEIVESAVSKATDAPVPGTDEQGFQAYIYKMVSNVMGKYASSIANSFSAFTSIFAGFKDAIDRIRAMTLPIRMFIKNMADRFYKVLSSAIISISYSFNKMRNALRRSLSGFNLVVHSVDHMLAFFDSFYNGPFVKAGLAVGDRLNWVFDLFDRFNMLAGSNVSMGAASNFCFHPDTMLKMYDPISKTAIQVPISQVKTGQYIVNRGIHQILAILEFENNQNLMDYNGILVSDSHLVKEDEWKRIGNSSSAKPTEICPNRVYSLITDTHRIMINEIEFADYVEISNPYVNMKINDLIFNSLNKEGYVFSFTDDIQPGFAPHTPIMVDLDTTKSIEDFKIGDNVYGGKIMGRIEYVPKLRFMNRYRNILVGEGTKILDDGLWMPTNHLVDSIDICTNTPMFNLISSNGVLNVKEDGLISVFRDFLETHDNKTLKDIDDYLCNVMNNKFMSV